MKTITIIASVVKPSAAPPWAVGACHNHPSGPSGQIHHGRGRCQEKEMPMSLDVSPELLDQARRGPVDDAAFVATVRESLPYAYALITGLAAELAAGNADFADNQVPPPSEADRGQLLRALASDSIRGSLESHFGVRLAFQNCHRVAVFPPGYTGPAYQEFVSPRAQLLNQSPALRNC
jgi:hypothetical protein